MYSVYPKKKESIFLPKSGSISYSEDTGANMGDASHQEDRSKSFNFDERFKSYLTYCYSKVKELKSEISKEFFDSIKKVIDLPSSSYAFYVGVKELDKMAKAEYQGGVQNDSWYGSISSKCASTLSDMKNFTIDCVRVVIRVGRELGDEVGKSTRAVIGEGAYESIFGLVGDYLDSFSKYLLSFFSDQENKRSKELHNMETFRDDSPKLFSYVFQSGNEKSSEKNNFLENFLDNTGRYFTEKKSYFCHNILDKDEKYNPLTPEILLEGDIKDRPIFDPLPPEWVQRLKKDVKKEA